MREFVGQRVVGIGQQRQLARRHSGGRQRQQHIAQKVTHRVLAQVGRYEAHAQRFFVGRPAWPRGARRVQLAHTPNQGLLGSFIGRVAVMLHKNQVGQRVGVEGVHIKCGLIRLTGGVEIESVLQHLGDVEPRLYVARFDGQRALVGCKGFFAPTQRLAGQAQIEL